MADEPANERDARVDALKKLAADKIGISDLGRYPVLLDLISEALPELSLNSGDRVQALLHVFRQVLGKAHAGMPPNLLERKVEGPPAYILSAAEVLGITGEADWETFRTKLTDAQYCQFESRILEERLGPVQVRQLRAAYWHGTTTETTGYRNTKAYVRALLAAAEAQLGDPDVRDELRAWMRDRSPFLDPTAQSSPSDTAPRELTTTHPTAVDDDSPRQVTKPLRNQVFTKLHTRLQARREERRAFLAELEAAERRAEESRIPLSRWDQIRIAALFYLVLGGIPLSSRLLLAYAHEPFLSIDESMLAMNVHGYVPYLSISLLLLTAVAVASNIEFVRGRVVSVSLIVTTCFIVGHLLDYPLSVGIGSSNERSARTGDVIHAVEFNESDEACSRIGMPGLSLNSCQVEDGLLRAGTVSQAFQSIGVLPTDGIGFEATKLNGVEHVYYVETRFRTNPNMSACGLYLGGVNVFFHVEKSSLGIDVYSAELLRITTTQPTVGSPNAPSASFARIRVKSKLLNVGRRTFPGWTYGTWTALAAMVFSDSIVFFVNDYPVFRLDHSGATTITPSVGVTAGSSDGGGSATCEFDYVRVRTAALT